MTDQKTALQHYYDDDGGQLERVRKALLAAGLKPGEASVADLAPLDHFHTRESKATVELAELAEIPRGALVIDVGSGLGGPARHLAETYGCRVTGVDFSPVFCNLATMLSEYCGMEDRTTFQQGNALELPCADDSFDLAWTFQVQMNIEDKALFYREIFRVLRPGGRLAFQDIFQGDGKSLYFPVPWASDPSMSFLINPEQCRELLRETGFMEVAWRDQRPLIESEARPAPAPEARLPLLGAHVVIGEEYLTVKRPNSQKAFREGRIENFQGIFDKPI
ncbi:MAG: methyltransferase domain-containing protein [bacterium]